MIHRGLLAVCACAALVSLGSACSGVAEREETAASGRVVRGESAAIDAASGATAAKEEAGRARVGTVSSAPASASHPPPASRRVVESENGGIATVDRGIGIVYFDRQPGSDTRAGDSAAPGSGAGVTADTLIVLRDTMRDAVAARYILRGDGGTSWSYTLEAPDVAEGNSVEFAYEVEGLPVDRSSADERWVRAIYGIGSDGSPRYGWVKVTPGMARFQRWSALLRERTLFFAEGVRPEFFGSPRGKPVAFELPPGGANLGDGGYIMHPIEVRGEWMQVRVTTPSDMCGSPASVRQALLWIRYLNEDGRPRVWYHTRGC